MCLWIKNGTKKTRAEEDILVYKQLCTYKRKGRTVFTGPFMSDYEYKFDSLNRSYNKIPKNRLKREHAAVGYVVNYGLHAYTYPYLCLRYNRRNYFAVIPAGSEYYIGDCDVVSTALIVFKSKNDYVDYKKEHKVNENMFPNVME